MNAPLLFLSGVVVVALAAVFLHPLPRGTKMVLWLVALVGGGLLTLTLQEPLGAWDTFLALAYASGCCAVALQAAHLAVQGHAEARRH